MRAQLAATASSTGGAETEPLDALTPQEQQIARFVTSGATNKDVAAKLFLSQSTIAYHLHNIYLKLGVGSRGELAALLGATTSHADLVAIKSGA